MASGVATVWAPLHDMIERLLLRRDARIGRQDRGDDWTEFDANGLTIGLNARKGTHKVRGGGAVVDGRLDDPMELLESEGSRFTLGRADPELALAAVLHPLQQGIAVHR